MMDSKKKIPDPEKGSMIMAVLFVVFASFVGLTLLTHTISQNRIIRYRIKKIEETDRIQQELIHYLHCFREKIMSENLNSWIHPETDYFTAEFFPDTVSRQVKLKNHFYQITEEKGDYRKIRIKNTVEGQILNGNQVLNADAVIDLLSGNIPLSLIPLVTPTGFDIHPDQFLPGHDIMLPGPGTAIMDDLPVDFDVSSFLIDALKIRGEILSWARIRERFGFEISDQPIETGIYFMIENNILESVFIQGDIQKMVFSVSDDLQVIKIHLDGTCHELSYRPGGSYIQSWNERIPESTAFRENIIVNGNLWSLEQAGGSAFREDANIKLLVSGQTIIRTSLETKNLELEKLRLTRLTLITGTHQLYGPENGRPEVLIETDDKTQLQITLLVEGNFKNKSPELDLTGSLFTETVVNEGRLNISHLRSAWDSGSYFHTGNTTLVVDFFIDCIEEVHNAFLFKCFQENERVHRG